VPDRYQQLVTSQVGRQVAETVGLPVPEPLRRYTPGQPVLDGPVLVGDAPGGRLLGAITDVLGAVDADVRESLAPPTGEDERFAALVFDATGIAASSQLEALYGFFHDAIRRLDPPAGSSSWPARRPRATCASARPSVPSRASHAPSARSCAAAGPPT
jgi:3-oxoacyl-[acyl-carrier protein] reductase